MDFDHEHPFGFASGTPGRDWTAKPDERWKDWSIIFVGTAVRLFLPPLLAGFSLNLLSSVSSSA